MAITLVPRFEKKIAKLRYRNEIGEYLENTN